MEQRLLVIGTIAALVEAMAIGWLLYRSVVSDRRMKVYLEGVTAMMSLMSGPKLRGELVDQLSDLIKSGDFTKLTRGERISPQKPNTEAF